MVKKLLSLSAIFLFVCSATTFAQQIGYMDTQEVLNKLPERQQVQDKMDAFTQKEQTKLKKRSTKYQDAIAEYQSNRSSMTQEQISTREDELTVMRNSLDEFNQTIKQEVQQKRQNLLQPIFERIDKAISAVAESNGLDLVINKSTNSGESLIFYASSDQNDITDDVIAHLNSTDNK